jgi:hypothetical protein
MENPYSHLSNVDKLNKAKELSEKAIADCQSLNWEIEMAQDETRDVLELYGRFKIEVLGRTLCPFFEQLSRIEDIELREELSESEESNNGSAPESGLIDIRKENTLREAIAAGGLTAKNTAISYGAVGSSATVITELGLSLVNSDVAFSLERNVGGILSAHHLWEDEVTERANSELMYALQDTEQVQYYRFESHKVLVQLTAIRRTALRLHRILMRLESMITPMVKVVSGMIDTSLDKMMYNPTKKSLRLQDMPELEQNILEEMIHLGRKIKNILDLSIVDDEGVVPDETYQFISKIEEFISKSGVAA